MTREEREKAIRVLDDMKVKIDIPKAAVMQNDKNWALDMAIKALEQEPCEDAPSAQSKMGHWIEGQTDNPNIHNILCSCCFEGCQSKGHANSQYTKEKFQYCPKCGARMIEPQESEGRINK